MKVIQIQFCILLLVATTGYFINGETPQQNDININKISPRGWSPSSSKLSNRFKRQTSTTTPKPKKHRPSNIFSLISELITETRDDASKAFNEIGTLFNSQFVESNATTTKRPTSTTSTTESSSSSSDSEDDNEITTTETYRISRNEFLGILRSNVQGIVQLFGKEFRVAIKDSNQNVRDFGKDLGTALRPYFT